MITPAGGLAHHAGSGSVGRERQEDAHNWTNVDGEWKGQDKGGQRAREGSSGGQTGESWGKLTWGHL